MTRTESIASLYATMTGKNASDITKGELDQWLNLDSSVALETINASMLAMDNALTYPAGDNAYVKATFEAVFGYLPDENADGFAYWVNEIESGSVSRDTLAIALLNGAATADQARAIAKIEAAVGNLSAGQEVYLTTEQDVLTGAAGNDTFNAFIFGNTDTAQSGDRIDGGAGDDTLYADMGTYQSFATTISTTSVENFKVRAEASDYSDNAENNTNGTQAVEVDAERMEGTNHYESNNSRADLVIEDVRIEANQITKDITVAMVQTDPGDVDFGVYFDQPSLVNAPSESAGAGLDIEIMDLTAVAAGEDPLLKNPYNKVLFELGAHTVHLEIEDQYIHGSYDLLLEGVQKALVEYNVTYPASESVADLTNVVAEFNGTFDGINSSDGRTYTGQVITLTTDDDREFNPLGFLAEGVSDPSAEILANLTPTDPSASTFLITSTIILDDVGRGSMGGDLIVGGLSTGITSDSKGVEQFDITVERSSELQEINSTNNTLEEVYIVNGATQGNLVVAGDTNGDNDIPGAQGSAGFTDVRVVDASAMAGSVSINAELTSAVTAKYMNSVDIQNNASSDNVNFEYSLGTNNDTLNLSISEANLANAGTTTREDFNLEISGGTGNDVINTVITTAATSDETNWYTNSQDSANLTINAGSGDDTVTTSGAGDFVINTDSGNDTVYTDNSGLVNATWALNADNANIDDLDGNALNTHVLYKSTVTVTYSGANVAGESGVISADANSYVNGYESTVQITNDFTGTQADVNQAIKEAINEDAVLNKLLSATDGPNNTLVITSKIDGTFNSDDLEINIDAYDFDANSSDYTEIQNAWKEFTANSSAANITATDLETYVDGFQAANTSYGTNMNLVENGTASVAVSDNTINLGTGSQDLVVLSTDANSNDTVVLEGSFGYNTIVNFTTENGNAQDALDFSSYLTSEVSSSGSVVSQTLIAVSLNTDTNIEANSVTLLNNFQETVDANNNIYETWANLTASSLKDALNNDLDDNNDSYGNITEGDYETVVETDLVGSTYKSVMMVENDLNAGEYKVFEITAQNDSNDSFTSVVELGTLDFGAELTDIALPSLNGTVSSNGGSVVPPVAGSRTFDTTTEVVDLTSYDAATGNQEFTFTMGTINATNIDNFGTHAVDADGIDQGDAINIPDEYVGNTASMLIDTDDDQQITFVFGDTTSFNPTWTINFNNSDATLVDNLEAAADTAAQVALLDAAWGDWII